MILLILPRPHGLRLSLGYFPVHVDYVIIFFPAVLGQPGSHEYFKMEPAVSLSSAALLTNHVYRRSLQLALRPTYTGPLLDLDTCRACRRGYERDVSRATITFTAL